MTEKAAGADGDQRAIQDVLFATAALSAAVNGLGSILDRRKTYRLLHLSGTPQEVLDRARRQAFAAHAIEPWEFDVLAALRRAGTPYELSPSELMAQTLVTSGTMTTRVEKLAARRLVQRSRRETGDRRGVRVQLTDAGREVVDAAFEALLAHERTLLSSLSVADQAELANLLRDLVLPFDDHES
jgi:DNA-binding MarR family transcriptional regulator